MKQITLIILGIVLIIGGIYLMLSAGSSEVLVDEEITEVEYDKAPDFSLKDYEGNKISLSDFRDKVVIINSWATWCPFCVKELDDFAKLQEEFGDEIVVVAIDRSESLEKTKGFTDNLGVTDRMIFLLDPSDSYYKSIGGFSMPETIFVDSERNIRLHKRGPMDLKEMTKIVNGIINN